MSNCLLELINFSSKIFYKYDVISDELKMDINKICYILSDNGITKNNRVCIIAPKAEYLLAT